MVLLDFIPLRWLRNRYRKSKLEVKSSTISTFRCSEYKPPILSYRRLELFYKERPVRSALQIAVCVGVAIWTIRNYIHVIHSL